MKTMTLEQLKNVLIMQKTHFQYKNRDGTINEVYGTLQYAFIPESKWPKSSREEDEAFKYYDLYEEKWNYIDEDVIDINVLSE